MPPLADRDQPSAVACGVCLLLGAPEGSSLTGAGLAASASAGRAERSSAMRDMKALRAAITAQQRFFPTCYGSELVHFRNQLDQLALSVKRKLVQNGLPLVTDRVDADLALFGDFRDRKALGERHGDLDL